MQAPPDVRPLAAARVLKRPAQAVAYHHTQQAAHAPVRVPLQLRHWRHLGCGGCSRRRLGLSRGHLLWVVTFNRQPAPFADAVAQPGDCYVLHIWARRAGAQRLRQPVAWRQAAQDCVQGCDDGRVGQQQSCRDWRVQGLERPKASTPAAPPIPTAPWVTSLCRAASNTKRPPMAVTPRCQCAVLPLGSSGSNGSGQQTTGGAAEPSAPSQPANSCRLEPRSGAPPPSAPSMSMARGLGQLLEPAAQGRGKLGGSEAERRLGPANTLQRCREEY